LLLIFDPSNDLLEANNRDMIQSDFIMIFYSDLYPAWSEMILKYYMVQGNLS